MSDAPAKPASHRPDRDGATVLGRRALLAGGTLLAVIVAYFIVAATVPRWWAQRIGDQVDGSMTAGVGLGLFYGFAFTFLPLLVLSFAVRKGRSWRVRAWLAGIAVVLALPNLMTLGIVLGTGDASHAGERILDVDGPGFRASSLAGAIVGAVVVVGVRALMVSRRRAKGRASRLGGELRTREQAERAEAERVAAAREGGRPPEGPAEP